MKERDILKHIKNTVDQAPLDILSDLKNRPVQKMREHDEITRQKTAKPNIWKRYLPYSVAAAAFIGLFFQWQSQYVWADSQVYFDVNPSIIVTTNKREQVIRMDGINTEAQQIIEGIDYKGKTLIQVTENLMDQLLGKNYLTETEKYILLSVYNKREEVAQQQQIKIDEVIHEHLLGRELNPIVLVQSIATPKDTQSGDLEDSEGRATLIRKLLELAPNLREVALKEMSIHELVNIARAFNVDLHQLFESQDFEEIESEEIKDFEFHDNDDLDNDGAEDDHSNGSEDDHSNGSEDDHSNGSEDNHSNDSDNDHSNDSDNDHSDDSDDHHDDD